MEGGKKEINSIRGKMNGYDNDIKSQQSQNLGTEGKIQKVRGDIRSKKEEQRVAKNDKRDL